jgi:hypothetical protein
MKGKERCGNCAMFRPLNIFKGCEQSSYCSVREHNRYGSLIPGDPYEDKSRNPKQTKLAVTVNCNDEGSCNLFEPNYTAIEKWRKEEKKYKKRNLEQLKV